MSYGPSVTDGYRQVGNAGHRRNGRTTQRWHRNPSRRSSTSRRRSQNPQCTGALHVTVVPNNDYRVPATWEVASFNPGSSERELCELALCRIVSRLRQRFDVSP